MDRGYDTRSPIQKKSSLPRTFSLFRTYILVALLFFVASVSLVIAHAPLFQIRTVMVSGAMITPNENVQIYIAKALEGNWRVIFPLNSVISICKLLPNLDDILVSWKNRAIDQYQIFHLGQYISESLKLIGEEIHFAKTQSDRHLLNRILKILKEYTTGDFSKITLSRSEEKIKNDLNEQNKLIEKIIDIS